MGSFNGVGFADDAFAFDTCGGHVEGDCSSNYIGGFDFGGPHGAFAEYDDAVGIADDGVSAEFCEFGEPGEAAFVDFIPKVHDAFCFRRDRNHEGKEINGEIGPGGGFDLGEQVRGKGLLDTEGLIRFDDTGFAFGFDFDAEFGETTIDEWEVLGDRIFNANFAAGDGSDGEEGGDFVVVGGNGGLSAAELLDSGDFEDAGAGAFNLGAHVFKEPAEVLDMRFGSCVGEGGRAVTEGGGHEKGFGGGDRHVVGPVGGALETVFDGKFEDAVMGDLGPEVGQDLEVGIEFADTEGAAFGIGVEVNFFEAVKEGGQ